MHDMNDTLHQKKKKKNQSDLCCKNIEFGLEKSNLFLRTWKKLAFWREKFKFVLIKENQIFWFENISDLFYENWEKKWILICKRSDLSCEKKKKSDLCI